MPAIEVRSRRVGGSNYQIPTEIRPDRRTALAIKWILSYARGRNEKTMATRLANELMAAANNEGNSVKKKEALLLLLRLRPVSGKTTGLILLIPRVTWILQRKLKGH
jgi:hypothetical protein